MKILKIDWLTYIKDLEVLAEKLKGKNYGYILGLPRGGLIPAVYLSHQLGIPYFEATPRDLLTATYPAPLVVDDLIDTGKTLHKCVHDVAVVYIKDDVPIQQMPKSTIYVARHLPNEWLVFPYEKDENS